MTGLHLTALLIFSAATQTLSIESLPIVARVDLPKAPDWQAIGFGSNWVTVESPDRLVRIDPHLATVVAEIPIGSDACLGIVIALRRVWVATCGDHALNEIDPRTNAVIRRIPVPIASPLDGSFAIEGESVWIPANAIDSSLSTIARIDVRSGAMVAKISVGADSGALVSGHGAVWAASGAGNELARIDIVTNSVVAHVAVGPSPRFMAIGERAIWVLNRTDGSVSRVDPKANREVVRIDTRSPTKWGDIAIGGGVVWTSTFGKPLTRIDPVTNTVTHEFVGPGGDSVRYGNGALWVTDQKKNMLWKIDPAALNTTQ